MSLGRVVVLCTALAFVSAGIGAALADSDNPARGPAIDLVDAAENGAGGAEATTARAPRVPRRRPGCISACRRLQSRQPPSRGRRATPAASPTPLHGSRHRPGSPTTTTRRRSRWWCGSVARLMMKRRRRPGRSCSGSGALWRRPAATTMTMIWTMKVIPTSRPPDRAQSRGGLIPRPQPRGSARRARNRALARTGRSPLTSTGVRLKPDPTPAARRGTPGSG